MSGPTTVLLVDDHELIRQGLRQNFERDSTFQVVGEAGSGAEAESLVDTLSPQVVIMDIRLPDASGLDVTRSLRARHPTLGIVVLTMYAGDEQVLGALDAGASAFIPKSAPAQEVMAAARHAAVAPGTFSAADLAGVLRRASSNRVQLTAREREVLGLLAQGLPVAAIAKQLFISQSTTKSHIARLYEKLEAGNRAHAMVNAMRLGLLPPGIELP
ncbi:MAG: response regulator transcription factor [Actinomycetota bacterium]|nr:response regulator transcription factor [Actinomycetota bacterium]